MTQDELIRRALDLARGAYVLLDRAAELEQGAVEREQIEGLGVEEEARHG